MNGIISLDNGTTGTMTIIKNDIFICDRMPIKKHLNYTKSKQFIHRVDWFKFKTILEYTFSENEFCNVRAFVERPMVNPTRWKQSLPAIRCLEAVEIIFEMLGIGYEFLDSREWQAVMLPQVKKKEYIDKAGRKRSKYDKGEIKEIAKQVAGRMFPNQMAECSEYADSLLMAEYVRRNKIGGTTDAVRQTVE